jgi:hypothetical protein
MSKGGSFNVIINQQNPDDMINNNRRFKERLNEFNERAKHIKLDPNDPDYISIQNSVTPILNFLERTHHVFINGAFKPHVPIAYQYTKYSASNPRFGSKIEFDVPPYGDFWSDMVLHIKLSGLSVVDPRDRIRYISYPGSRIGELYQFKCQGIKLDEYDYNLYGIHRQFNVPTNKQAGWDKCMGQEVPIRGFITPDPYNDMYREYKIIGNGAQTLKQNQEDLDLWIPIMFWFRDVRFAFPQIIADGQTKLTINLSQIQNLVAIEDLGGGGKYYEPTISVCDLYINNIFMQEDVFQLFLKNFNFTLMRVNTYQLNTINSANITNIKLYGIKFLIENLFVGFRPQSNLTLSQYWNKFCSLTYGEIPTPVLMKNPNIVWTGSTISSSSNQIKINGSDLSTVVNYYINYYFVLTGGTGYNSDNIVQNTYIVSGWDPINQIITINTNWLNGTPDTTTTWELYTLQPGKGFIQYYQESDVVDSLELRSFDISVRGPWPSNFYTRYLPYHLGPRLNSENLFGWYIIPFGLYPLSSNPSGYIDFTQSRENYLYWTSSVINQNNPVDLVVYGQSMNFLIFVNNTASLRYS